jgi:GT2 family glycosyltransferase
MLQNTSKFKVEHIIVDNILNDKSYSEALNEGIRASHYPFVLILDDDDVLHADTINALGEAMIKNPKDKVYRVSCNQLLIDVTGAPIGTFNYPCLGMFNKELLMTVDNFPDYSWNVFKQPNSLPMIDVLEEKIGDKLSKVLVQDNMYYAKRIHRGMVSFLRYQETYEQVLYNANMGRNTIIDKGDGATILKMYELIPPKIKNTIPKKRRVMVGIVTHNNQRTIRACLSSVAYSTHKELDVMVVDNKSDDETIKQVEKFENDFGSTVYKTPNDKNEGFAYGCNQILQAANDSGSDAVVFLNPDAYLPPNGIEYMLACSARHDAGIVGVEELVPNGDVAHNLVAYNKQTKDFDKVQNVAINWDGFKMTPTELPVPGVTFSCVMILNPLFKVLKLDTKFGLGYFEDVDYCVRARKKGFSIWTTPYVKVIHHKHTSWDPKPRDALNELYKKNYYYLIKKHGDPPIEDMMEMVPKWKSMQTTRI